MGSRGTTLAPVRTELHAGWTLRAAGGPAPAPIAGAVVPAAVPGCVHTDLLAAGLIEDPYLDANETGLAWIGRTDWRYTTGTRKPIAVPMTAPSEERIKSTA